MFEIFLILSLYQQKINVLSNNNYQKFHQLSYGFKKRAHFSCEVSNQTRNFIFGLATKEEIKRLDSIESYLYLCDSDEHFSEIQYNITNNTAIDLIIPSKTILTPFSISCEKSYNYYLQINIINGNNHLDYRLQTMMICILIFSIVYLVIFIIAFLCCIFVKQFKEKYTFQTFANVIFYNLLIGMQGIFIYIEYLHFKNNEYISNILGSNIEIIRNAFCAVIILFFNFDTFILYFTNKKSFKEIFSSPPYFFINIALYSVCTIVISLCDDSLKSKFNYKTYFAFSFLYLVMICLHAALPITFSLKKLGSLIYLCGGYFTFALRAHLLQLNNWTPTGIVLMNIDLLTLIFNGIYIVFLLIDFFCFHNKYSNIDNITNNTNNTFDNFTYNYQRNQTLLLINNDEDNNDEDNL